MNAGFRFLASLFLCVLAAGCVTGPQRIADLTHSFGEDTLYWPTSERFRMEIVHQGVKPEGYYYEAGNFCASEHGGTHVDAPVHFVKGSRSVDQIPLEQLVGDGIVVDVSARCAMNRDYRIVVQDFLDWEEKNGVIPDESIVLLYTGFGKLWPDAEKYLGTARRGPEGVKELHFPGLDPAAAVWLVEQRHIKAVGLDTASIDYGQSTTFATHRTLAEREIPAFENLADLEQLPAKGFRVVALPMKIKKGSGAPLRIIALY